MKSQLIFVLLVVLVLLLSFPPTTFATTASFQGLGDLPGWDFYSRAEAVSSDGSTVVGGSRSASGFRAFLWTINDGMVSLGDLPSGSYDSRAHGVSSDGSVITGSYNVNQNPPFFNKAFMWTAGDGMVNLHGNESIAFSVSGDGSVIVGITIFPRSEAFRWTVEEGIVGMGFLPGGYKSGAIAVSEDGYFVVGYSTTAKGTEAFRWTADGGMFGLSDLPGGSFQSLAYDVSVDGIVVGVSKSALGSEAFRWTAETGMIGLGFLPGCSYSWAYAISGNGSVIIGYSNSGAFLWTEDEGMVNVKDMLENKFGLNLSGWTLSTAVDISYDGLTIVGNGWNPNGFGEAWIATIPKPVVEAEIDIDPDTINLKSKGKWISCQIWFPVEYDVADVDSDSIFLKFLEEEIKASWIWFNEEEQVVMAKFNRTDVQDIFETGEVEIAVTGEFADGTRFSGTDTIRVIDKGGTEYHKSKP